MSARNEVEGTQVGQERGMDECEMSEVVHRSAAIVESRSGLTPGRRGLWPTLVVSTTMMVGSLVATPVQAAGPAPVNLGTAGNFVVLSKAGISTTGVTSITGNIGVSPISASAITGFGLILAPSGRYSKSSLVIGRIFAADYAPPTPAMMTTAVGDMETAYTDAAGRTLPGYTELYAGDLTGQTLPPGLYKWSTGVLVSAGGVTIAGSPTDVWIFQVAQDLTIDSGAIVSLSGGASPTNVFWQVAGQASLGTTAQMKGIILSETQIVMSTGARLLGRALAQTAVTLDANDIRVAAANDGLFSDDFETGNMSRWSSTVQ